MRLIPAIDLLHGEVVRLRHGDFDRRTHYPSSAAELARDYAAAGADWLHVVDLAASRDGPEADLGPLLKLLGSAPQQVQTGGGVRSGADIRVRLAGGAARVVVGTVGVSEPQRLIRWLDEFGPERVVSALDVTPDPAGELRPRMRGWTEAGLCTLWELLDQLVAGGLRHLLCTDIGRDGALRGPNVGLYRDLVSRYPGLQVQASGGVSGLGDLVLLQGTGVSAAITGKALLDGRFTVQEALQVLR